MQPNLNGSHLKNEKPKTISHITIYSSSAEISKLLRKSLFGAIQGSNFCLPESDPVFGEKRMEWHTKGPLATYLNPIDSPYSLQKLNFSGVTYSFTVKWSGVGCNISHILQCQGKAIHLFKWTIKHFSKYKFMWTKLSKIHATKMVKVFTRATPHFISKTLVISQMEPASIDQECKCRLQHYAGPAWFPLLHHLTPPNPA